MVGGFNIGHLARNAPRLVTRFGQAGLDLVRAGSVRVDVTGEVPLADARTALDQLTDGVNRGKLVLRVR